MDAFLELTPWPEVLGALTSLRRSGLRLGFLSNFTPRMLAANLEISGLGGLFDHVLSTDRARTFAALAALALGGSSPLSLDRCLEARSEEARTPDPASRRTL